MKLDLAPGQRADGTPMMSVTRGIGQVLFPALCQIRIDGGDNLPRTGCALIAANHTDFVDGPLLYGTLRRPAVFFVKSEAFIGPLDPFLRRIGQIPVHRGVVERGPLVAALDTLNAGGLVGVFPEGSRGSGDVASVRHGIAYLAVRSGAPVVPVACFGTRAILHRRSLRRPPVRIAFGAPVHIPAGPAAKAAVAGAAEQIRAALAALVTGGQS